MRLLHPRTMQIISTEMRLDEFESATVSRKQIISHASSELSKYLATRKNHPKMFLPSDRSYGFYLAIVKYYADIVDNNLDIQNFTKYDDVYCGFVDGSTDIEHAFDKMDLWFDGAYLFSDAVSLYFKGVNIFPHIYGDEWEKYCPIINLKEIQRVVTKTLDKRKDK